MNANNRWGLVLVILLLIANIPYILAQALYCRVREGL